MRTPDEQAVASAIIHLMRDVVYREVPAHEAVWETLQRQRGRVAAVIASMQFRGSNHLVV